MLMIVPILKNVTKDYSGTYALREIFWFGRSSCTDPYGFFCHENSEMWISTDGWYALLRGLAKPNAGRKLLWLYVPNYVNNGTLDDIKRIPQR